MTKLETSQKITVVSKRRPLEPGAAPGRIEVDPDALQTRVRLLAYSPDAYTEEDAVDLATLGERLADQPVTWVQVSGLGDAAKIKEIGRIFDLHPLALEDVVNTHQRPKLEDFDSHLFLVLRAPKVADPRSFEQVGVFMGERFVVTFTETHDDRWDKVRGRIRRGRGRLRSAGADYLAYALVDAVVDHQLPVVAQVAERLEALEIVIAAGATPDALHELLGVRQELLALQRLVRPQHEMLGALLRDDTSLVQEATFPYLRDCHDHAAQLADHVEAARETATGLMNVHLSLQGYRTSEIMRVLTIIATLFIPLTFIAGLYGMNFNPAKSAWNMPELNWAFGYPAALGMMALVAASFLIFFRRKGWLGGKGADDPRPDPGESGPGE